jgi:hypothetical protein
VVIVPEVVIVPPDIRPAVAILVTVPVYWSAEFIVKLGYVPVIVVVPP